jgi:hypothetical protein
MMRSSDMDKLINAVLAQIKEDIIADDMTSIEELLRHTPEVTLLAYLPEEQWADHATPEPTDIAKDATMFLSWFNLNEE